MPAFLNSRLLVQTLQQLSTLTRVRGLTTRAVDLYEVLGVTRTCSQAHIKVAFYRQAKKMHPDVQREEEAERQAEEFIRLAAAYEVLRDPARRATYDAHLSSRSKFVRSAFDFDPDGPSPAQDTDWPEEPTGDRHVAPWVKQYRQAVREVVKYGGEGDGLAHLVKAEFGAAVRKAYFGPQVEGLALGEWPMEFEGEERSVEGIGDVMHLVSGRQLLGTAREARDTLLGGGVNSPLRRVLETGTATDTRSIEAENQRVKRKMDGTVGVGAQENGFESDFGNGKENGTEKGTESGTGQPTWGKADSFGEGSNTERLRDMDGNGENRSGLFATLELTQHGEVVGVATREWVPLTEGGTRSGTEDGEGDSERIDCISIYAVNREERSEEGEDAFRHWQRGGVEGEASAQSAEHENGSQFGESGSGSAKGNGSGPENADGCENRNSDENLDRNGDGHWSKSSGTAGNGTGTGKGTGNRNGTEDCSWSGTGTEGLRGDGWAEDVERLGMRYRRPRLLARIFGLRDGRASTEVFREGGAKTHTLLQHRTPLVRHMAWYRSDVDKRGRRIRKCEARLRRAAMLPSSLWLFEPRASTHDCGGWYFERFSEEETRGASPFGYLPPHASQSGQRRLGTNHGRDPSHAQYRFSDLENDSRSGRTWASSDMGSRSQHSLRFDWPSSSADENAKKEDEGSMSQGRSKRLRPFVATPLDPAVYILTAAYLTLDKEEEVRRAKPSAVADLLQKGSRWTGELRAWWKRVVGA